MQIKLGSIGEVAQGLQDLQQEIFLILATPLGSVPHRPEFGSRIYEYLDLPQHLAKPLIIAEAYRALRANTERFEVKEIKVKDIQPGKIIFTLTILPISDEVTEEVKIEVLAEFKK